MKTKTQILAAAAAGLTALVGVTAGAVAVVKHNAHVQECNTLADRAIAEYFEAQDIMAQTKANQAALRNIKAEDGLLALIQLGNVTEAGERNRAQWDAFEARSNRNRAEFETVCGVARVNQMKADLRAMVK